MADLGRRIQRLQLGIGDEGGACLLRLGNAMILGRFDAWNEGSQKIGNLPELSGIVASDDQQVTAEYARHGVVPL